MWKQGVLTAALVAGVAGTAVAGEIDELKQQVGELTNKVNALRQAPVAADGYAKKLWERTTFGGYGELDAIFKRNTGGRAGGNSFDPHRIVLYMNSGLADWVDFKSELEWEHGGVKDEGAVEVDPATGSGSAELSGEVAVEQAFLDFKLTKAFNIRAGVLLVPLGAVNLYHEPTNFSSTERPTLDRLLIPSTWSEMGAGIFGSLGERVDYQLYAMNGLDGSKFSAKNGIRDGRQNLASDSNDGKVIAGRLEITPLTNLHTNFSFYAGNAAPRGSAAAFTTVAAFDGSWRYQDLELSGEYVTVLIDDPAALGVSDIGNRMSGYWVEGGYHVMPKLLKQGRLAEADAILFARYSEIDTQAGGAVDASKVNGVNDRSYLNVGLSFKPVPTVAVKADYQWYDDHRPAGAKPLDNDKFQITLGFVF